MSNGDTDRKTEEELWNVVFRRTDVAAGSRWVHVKSARPVVVGEIVIRESDLQPCVVYYHTDTYLSVPFTRPVSEFLDGRFRLEENPAQAGSVVLSRSIPPKPAFAMPRSPKWPQARKAHLAKEPLCAACGGKELVEVHHVLPYHERPDLELDESNFITLCEHPSRACHFRIGHCFDWADWNERVRECAQFFREMIEGRTS